MRILIRTSKWAIWSRRFGSLALPLMVLPVFLHRERLISSTDFFIVEAVAMLVAALALGLAISAFARLWVTGDQGWGKATLGLLFSLICLVPLAIVVWQAARYPAVTDVTTDYERPPGLVSQLPAQPLSPAPRAAVETAFPNARTRTYPVEAGRIYALLNQLVEDRDWEVRARREPQTPLAEGQINAVAMTLLGWRDEVAIRIQGTAEGSTVAMRSAALHGGHDLGSNGRRIEEFLAALDERITILLRETPTAQPTTDDPEEG
jgi:hypothetical protein